MTMRLGRERVRPNMLPLRPATKSDDIGTVKEPMKIKWQMPLANEISLHGT